MCKKKNIILKNMQTETEKALKNLSILASLSQNDKLNTNEDIYTIYIPTSVRGMVRFWYSEKRSSNIVKIHETVRTATKFVRQIITECENENFNYQKELKLQQCKRMVQSIIKSTKGLENLKQTYRDDHAITVNIQLIIDEIEDFITLINKNISNDGSSLFIASES